MIIVTLLALAQAASAPAPAPGQTTATSAPTAGSWSILNPPDCPVVKEGDKTIVVCAPGTESGARLPLPDWGPPDRPVASNPNMTAIRALELDGTPCAATQRGCQSGFGPPIAPLVAGAVALAKSAFAKKPDKTGRIAIDLSDPAPPAPARP